MLTPEIAEPPALRQKPLTVTSSLEDSSVKPVNDRKITTKPTNIFFFITGKIKLLNISTRRVEFFACFYKLQKKQLPPQKKFKLYIT
ncbi:MAG TPA: hypothetical protein DD657_13450 [Culturomica sp.]|nr:hypothetical protein [Culturomica sp.]